jgi:hypothetical protein
MQARALSLSPAGPASRPSAAAARSFTTKQQPARAVRLQRLVVRAAGKLSNARHTLRRDAGSASAQLG